MAWAHHTNLGDYTTASLAWLERCGKGARCRGWATRCGCHRPPPTARCSACHNSASPPCPAAAPALAAANFSELAVGKVPAKPATLSPARVTPPAATLGKWDACHKGGSGYANAAAAQAVPAAAGAAAAGSGPAQPGAGQAKPGSAAVAAASMRAESPSPAPQQQQQPAAAVPPPAQSPPPASPPPSANDTLGAGATGGAGRSSGGAVAAAAAAAALLLLL